jgi:dihydroflavonol-4-reductase
MEAFVTGATGQVGNGIAKRLIAGGHRVRALVRDEARARSCLPDGAILVRGDVTEPSGLAEAMDGVDVLFHAAGLPEQWQADERIFDRVNRQGTVNVLEAAERAGVRRVVYTSTMDVFAAPRGGTLVETNLDEAPKPTAYERSKQAADREVVRFFERGLEVVHVNPAAVYGPSPSHVGLNVFFTKLIERASPLLPPGGMSVVYVDGCTDAHLAAAEKGRPGQRYLVADTHVSNAALARAIADAAGLKKVPPVGPAWLLGAVAHASAPPARLFGFTPLIAPGQLSFLLWDVRCDTTKAEAELGFVPTPLEDGVARTVAWLREAGRLPATA